MEFGGIADYGKNTKKSWPKKHPLYIDFTRQVSFPI
jgi:hypothetical protein